MNLIFKSPFNATYGYARVVDMFLEYFLKNNINFNCISLGGVVDKKYKSYIKPIKKEIYDSSKELIVFPISFDLYNRNVILRLNSQRKRILYTMWESSNINSFLIKEFNEVSSIVVPCNWNKEIFIQCGTIVPIYVVPLGIDTNFFNYKPPQNLDCFVFGTGNNDYRKRLKDVIHCFCKAFHPKIRDVKLKIKISPQDNLGSYLDDRIEIINKNFSKYELSNWYCGIDIFVSGAYAEGWGLMQHEAMACGKPVISVYYGGIKDFFDQNVGYCLDYEEVMSDGPYEYSGGFWAKFNEDHLIELMRFCYNNRENVYKKGIYSAEKVKNLDENNSVKGVLDIIECL